MAVRARQQSYIPQPPMPEQPQHQPSPQKQKKTDRQPLISGKEKVLYITFIVAVAIFAVSLLHTQGQIQTTTMEVQKIESEVQEITKKNEDLKVQVSELSTYERIWEKAKELGLTLNEKNVKVVPGE
ncbi:cell division protein FtsL [Lysinibacillus odysseyi]|uniref:Cell division protein FtsL n=1 Tax=Lysinibacillus odysseyi 34hs-1 = NBRC 100172 TaxID=1220589 RepID=A0A0A3JAF4_9BACI|nr:cell division protein FtsL [Lysinibacillus odysseyi]KGR84012.1 cell division protein [Lysinibacillus odysseyi 34hs-1 = NBRC 100172]